MRNKEPRGWRRGCQSAPSTWTGTRDCGEVYRSVRTNLPDYHTFVKIPQRTPEIRKAIHTSMLSAALFMSTEKPENPKMQTIRTLVHFSSSHQGNCMKRQCGKRTNAQRLWPKGTEGSGRCPLASLLSQWSP